jgi:hypothetical protein
MDPVAPITIDNITSQFSCVSFFKLPRVKLSRAQSPKAKIVFAKNIILLQKSEEVGGRSMRRWEEEE